MKALFTKQQAKRIITDYQYLIGVENYLHPYPSLKVGFIRTEIEIDGSYSIDIGVNAEQLEIPEFMGYGEHFRPILIFLKMKGIQFDAAKYGF